MNNLTAVLQVRVRQEEKEALEAEAQEANVNLSVALRARIMQDLALLQPPVSKEAKEAVEEFPVESPGTIDQAMAAEKAATTTDVVAPIVRQAVERDSWITSTARILMMEKGLSKVAATMRATKEWEAAES